MTRPRSRTRGCDRGAPALCISHTELRTSLPPSPVQLRVWPALSPLKTQPHGSKPGGRPVPGRARGGGAARLHGSRAHFPPSPRTRANSAEGSRRQARDSGLCHDGGLSAHLIYVQFVRGADWGAGATLYLSINLPLIRGGDATPKGSFKTRKQFNLRRPASAGAQRCG